MRSIHPIRESLRRGAALLFVSGLLLAAGGAGAGEYSALSRPDRPSPVLLTVGPAVGGAPDWQLFRFGVGGSLLFRPDAAARILTPLHAWNTGFVIQWEYRDVDRGRSLLAGDVLLRRYLVGDSAASGSYRLFVGGGAGVARVKYPPATTASSSEDDTEDTESDTTADTGEDKYYALVLEIGYQRVLGDSAVLLWKLQWRNYVWGGRDYSNYTAHLRIGIPLPW